MLTTQLSTYDNFQTVELILWNKKESYPLTYEMLLKSLWYQVRGILLWKKKVLWIWQIFDRSGCGLHLVELYFLTKSFVWTKIKIVKIKISHFIHFISVYLVYIVRIMVNQFSYLYWLIYISVTYLHIIRDKYQTLNIRETIPKNC